MMGIANKMEKMLGSMLKYAGDVVKYEEEAAGIAKNMEEAGLKAAIARKKMLMVNLFI